MKSPGRTFIIILVVAGMVLAFLAGTVTAATSVAASVGPLTDGQWAALQASNAVLLDQGPAYLYLPLVLRNMP
jgi:hypothetical protein